MKTHYLLVDTVDRETNIIEKENFDGCLAYLLEALYDVVEGGELDYKEISQKVKDNPDSLTIEGEDLGFSYNRGSNFLSLWANTHYNYDLNLFTIS